MPTAKTNLKAAIAELAKVKELSKDSKKTFRKILHHIAGVPYCEKFDVDDVVMLNPVTYDRDSHFRFMGLRGQIVVINDGQGWCVTC